MIAQGASAGYIQILERDDNDQPRVLVLQRDQEPSRARGEREERGLIVWNDIRSVVPRYVLLR